MKNQQTTTDKCETNFDQIRCKKTTKARIVEIIGKIKKVEGVKFTPDQLLNFFVDQMTEEQIKMIQDQNINPITEEKRLKALWVKTHKKKISESEWKALLYSGALSQFIDQNSRLKAV